MVCVVQNRRSSGRSLFVSRRASNESLFKAGAFV